MSGVEVMARFHCHTETIEAVNYGDHILAGGYKFAVRFRGGKHADEVIRCNTVKSVMRLFDAEVSDRKRRMVLRVA